MVLVLRFLWLQWQHTNKDGTDPRRVVGWLLTLVTSLVLFPLFAPGLPLAIESVPVDQLNALPTLLWPILL
ncbi:hypothetical protein, partial [Klebsiella pneumoniae]|uniref:hypothetical protein n=1 Tax=Klebsiella pneumoniae TaxID=573 RepID=UPI0027306046